MTATETLQSMDEEVIDIPYPPDMVVGVDVDLMGEIAFDRFLRVSENIQISHDLH